MKFGIVGYGRFGKLWAEALKPHGEVLVAEKNADAGAEKSGIQMAGLATVAKADVVFVLTPISEFERSCQQLKEHLAPNTLVVDCCSVKTHPVAVMQRVFDSNQPLLATHPLFGPDSAKRNQGVQGFKIVICPIRCSAGQEQSLTKLFQTLGLVVLTSTPEEHDREMANSQGLVHFIGRGLAALDLQPQDIATPDFQALLNINTMVVNDTWRLFLDMHQYNPYTRQIRKKFIHQLQQLDKAIEDGNPGTA
jgi:prephenate dehydrogenase